MATHVFTFEYNPVLGQDEDQIDFGSFKKGRYISIRFPVEVYDYYLGAAYRAYKNAFDAEGDAKYIIDRMLTINGALSQ